MLKETRQLYLFLIAIKDRVSILVIFSVQTREMKLRSLGDNEFVEKSFYLADFCSTSLDTQLSFGLFRSSHSCDFSGEESCFC